MTTTESLVAPDHARRRLILLMEAGWSMGRLTIELGLTRKTLNSVLRGADCTADTASAICDTHLSISPDYGAAYYDAETYWDDEPPTGTCARHGCDAPAYDGGLGLCKAHHDAVGARLIGWA